MSPDAHIALSHPHQNTKNEFQVGWLLVTIDIPFHWGRLYPSLQDISEVVIYVRYITRIHVCEEHSVCVEKKKGKATRRYRTLKYLSYSAHDYTQSPSIKADFMIPCHNFLDFLPRRSIIIQTSLQPTTCIHRGTFHVNLLQLREIQFDTSDPHAHGAHPRTRSNTLETLFSPCSSESGSRKEAIFCILVSL